MNAVCPFECFNVVPWTSTVASTEGVKVFYVHIPCVLEPAETRIIVKRVVFTTAAREFDINRKVK